MILRKNSSVPEYCIKITRYFIANLPYILSVEDCMRLQNNSYLMSESYRHALCLALGLKTETSLPNIRVYEVAMKQIILPLCSQYNLLGLNTEEKQGVLEACVHCIERTRKLVDF